MTTNAKTPPAKFRWTPAELLLAGPGGPLADEAARAAAAAGRPVEDWLHDARLASAVGHMLWSKVVSEQPKPLRMSVSITDEILKQTRSELKAGRLVQYASGDPCVMIGSPPVDAITRARTLKLMASGSNYVLEGPSAPAAMALTVHGLPIQCELFCWDVLRGGVDWIGGVPTLTELAEVVSPERGIVDRWIRGNGGWAKVRDEFADACWDSGNKIEEDGKSGENGPEKALAALDEMGAILKQSMATAKLNPQQIKEGEELKQTMENERARLVKAVERRKAKKQENVNPQRELHALQMRQLGVRLLELPCDARDIKEERVPADKLERWKAHCATLQLSEEVGASMAEEGDLERLRMKVAEEFDQFVSSGGPIRSEVDRSRAMLACFDSYMDDDRYSAELDKIGVPTAARLLDLEAERVRGPGNGAVDEDDENEADE